MSTKELFVIAIALSMDAFAVIVSNCICNHDMGKKEMVLTSLSFGVFQGGMPIIGYFLGLSFATYIKAIDHWIIFVLLGVLGGKMIYDGWTAEDCDEEDCEPFSFKMLMVQSIATSLDALAVGIGLSVLNVNIFQAAGMITIATFIICLFGAYIGRKVGTFLGGKAEIVGGILLIGIGLHILMDHLTDHGSMFLTASSVTHILHYLNI